MTDWVEITALIAGPTLAVGLTLWREKSRQHRERKLAIMRQLLLTRSDASDPAFSAAINLVPIEFGHHPQTMIAWEAFIHGADHQDAKAEHVDALTKELMLALGYKERAASQVARSPYVANGFADQRRQMADVLKGITEIAKASTLGAQASVTMAEHMTGEPIPKA